jgi:uncharacterized protein YbjT (DUF2867 family)
MAPPSRKILVLGATGVIGKVLLNALLNAKNSFDRIGILTSAETLANKPELIASFKARGADILTGDLYQDEDVLEAYKGKPGTLYVLPGAWTDEGVRLRHGRLCRGAICY